MFAYISPSLLVVCQVVNAHGLASIPVAANELLEQDGIPELNVHAPFLEPLGTIGGTGNGGTNFTSEISSLIDGNFVALPAKSNGAGLAAYAAPDDRNVELFPPIPGCHTSIT